MNITIEMNGRSIPAELENAEKNYHTYTGKLKAEGLSIDGMPVIVNEDGTAEPLYIKAITKLKDFSKDQLKDFAEAHGISLQNLRRAYNGTRFLTADEWIVLLKR